MKPGNEYSTNQEESRPQSGKDPVVQQLKELGLPVTRENYLLLNYGKDVPEMTPELEAELPEILRQK